MKDVSNRVWQKMMNITHNSFALLRIATEPQSGKMAYDMKQGFVIEFPHVEKNAPNNIHRYLLYFYGDHGGSELSLVGSNVFPHWQQKYKRKGILNTSINPRNEKLFDKLMCANNTARKWTVRLFFFGWGNTDGYQLYFHNINT